MSPPLAPDQRRALAAVEEGAHEGGRDRADRERGRGRRVLRRHEAVERDGGVDEGAEGRGARERRQDDVLGRERLGGEGARGDREAEEVHCANDADREIVERHAADFSASGEVAPRVLAPPSFPGILPPP